MKNQLLTPEQIASCHKRVEDHLNNGDDMAIWNICRFNENKESRRHIRTLDATAPAPSAPQKAWEAWIHLKFAALAEKLVAKRDWIKRETEQKHKKWRLDGLECNALSGPKWIIAGTKMNNLQFARHLLADGYSIERTGIGTVRFIKGNLCMGPFRNRYLNAAVAFIEESPVTAPSVEMADAI